MRIHNIGDAPELWSFVPERKESTQIRGAFGSPEAFARYVAPRRNAAWCPEGFTTYGLEERDYGATFDEAISFCLDGWKQGAERVERLRDKINAANPTGPRIIRWDVAGAVPSVPRALSGNPLNMRRVDVSKLRRRPVLTLVSHYGARSGFEAASFVNRAAAVAAIVDRIEAAGFACHLIAFAVSRRDGISVSTAVTAKESTAPVDIARLAFTLGHPAMFRRITFAFRSSELRAESIGSSMGSTDPRLDTDTTQGIYSFPCLENASELFADEQTTASRGVQYLIDILRQQGCPAFPGDQSQAA